MMGRVVFLLEEPSMKTLLLELLPRLIPGWQHGTHFLLVPHEGKTDLEKSIPRKLKAWREPNTRFVVVRDNDNADCLGLKQRLRALCAGSGRDVLIRLVCQELESWYLGDPLALEATYAHHDRAIRQLVRRHPDPDSCRKPAQELGRILPQFQKHDAARRLGRLLTLENNRSSSFKAFVYGVRRLAGVT